MSDEQEFVCPPAHTQQIVRFKPAPGGGHSWGFAIVLSVGDGGIDVQWIANGGRSVMKDNVKHVDDPGSKDPNYVDNMLTDNFGGLWCHTESTIQLIELQKRVEELEKFHAALGDPDPKPTKKSSKKSPPRKGAKKPDPPTEQPTTKLQEPDLSLT